MDGPERAKEGRPKLEKVRSLLRLLRRLDVVRQPGQPWLGSFGRAPPPCRGQPCDRGCGVWDVELATRTFRESAPVDGVGRVAVPRPVRHLEEAELLCHFGWGHRCRGIAERAKETSDKRAGRKWGQLTGAMPRKWLLSRARERERERGPGLLPVKFANPLAHHWACPACWQTRGGSSLASRGRSRFCAALRAPRRSWRGPPSRRQRRGLGSRCSSGARGVGSCLGRRRPARARSGFLVFSWRSSLREREGGKR